MTGNREVITGGDFKRMVAGAYSELLLEYENVNARKGGGHLPGTHVLRTMGAAVMPLYGVKDESIGGLARRVSAAAVFGARGNAGVVLAQMFRGLDKGLSGKYHATSSEFGKAFQYGILYAQRVIPEGKESTFIKVAKAVAKGAYHAVRANVPISELLEAAISAGRNAIEKTGCGDEAGAHIMVSFLSGCLKGLDGNFVSPAVSLSLGLESKSDMPDPRKDAVRPYCITLTVKNQKANVADIEKQLKEFGNFALVEYHHSAVDIHLHTNQVGKVMEQAIGWGPLRDVRITNMSETHVLRAHDALTQVAALTVAADEEEAQRMQDAGASILVSGKETSCPSVAELVSAAHSDFASSYVLVSSSIDYKLVFRQVKRLLGDRVELVLAETPAQAETALRAFSAERTAAENAKAMKEAVEQAR